MQDAVDTSWRDTAFPPDAIEQQIPDARVALDLLREHDRDFIQIVRQRRQIFESLYGAQYETLLDNTERALYLGYARFAARHGHLGGDVHTYHNENHTLEILVDRLGAIYDHSGGDALAPADWLMLALFGALHDLRQREVFVEGSLVGQNEQASIAEAHRIMRVAGFDPIVDADSFAVIEMMIAGSTFYVSQPEAADGAGALAPTLVRQLSREQPGWQDDPVLRRRIDLTLLASDLDTANVAEPFIKYVQSAVRLCVEREQRMGRKDMGVASAMPVMQFLTDGQASYFFDLHQFDSALGAAVFGGGKANNAKLLRQLIAALRERYQPLAADTTGRQLIEEFLDVGRCLHQQGTIC